MSNPAANPQIGISGSARKYGIPSLTVTWKGNDGTTDYVGKVFGNIEKDSDAAVATGTDNTNEISTLNRTQRKRMVKLSIKAEADTIEHAKNMADNLPMKMDFVTIGHQGASVLDAQIETSYAIVESASARYTPENELVIDFSLVIHLNPDGTIKSFAAVS